MAKSSKIILAPRREHNFHKIAGFILGSIFGPILGAKMSWSNHGFRGLVAGTVLDSSLGGLKSRPRGLKSRPKRPQGPSESPQERPRRPQESSGRPRRAAREAPRPSQAASAAAREGPKAPKEASKGIQDASRAFLEPTEPWTNHFSTHGPTHQD